VIATTESKSEKNSPAAVDKKARVASVSPEPVIETVPMPVEETVAGDEFESEFEMMEESGAEQEVAMVEEIHEDEPAALLRRASLAAYLRGDLDDALAEAEASGVGADGAAALGRLQEMMGRCKQLYQASEMVEPVEACLWDAYMLDAMLGGGKGRIHSELRAWLGQMYYLLAQKEHNRGDDRAALQELKEALYHAPNLQPALELKEELGKQAS
jgi:hypothetical protein